MRWRRLASGVVWFLALAAGLPAQEAGPSGPDIRSSYYRGRPVTYQVIEGLAIYQGDIVLGTAEELEAARQSGGQPGLRKAMVVSSPADLWPGGVVPYVIDSNLTSPKRVVDAINHWNSRTPIRLVERTNEPNWVRFYPTPGTGICSSSVGMVGLGEQRINLDRGCDTTAIIHEIGHTVGLWHEQSRWDRDAHVEIRYQNIDKRYAYNFEQELSDGADSGSYDFGSIMHYGPYDFSRNGQPSIETIPPGIPIGVATGLSEGDIDGVRRLYGQPPSATVVTTNPPGLQVEVDGVSYTAPATLEWTPGSTHTLSVPSPQREGSTRYVFGRWSDDGGQTHQVTASASLTVFTASFIEQYSAVTMAYPAAGGTIEISPASSDGFYPLRSAVELKAVPADGYNFLNWAGFLSGCANPLRASAKDLPFAWAEFTQSAVTTVASDPPGRRVVVDGLAYTVPRNFEWAPGSAHALSVTSPQTVEPARYVFRAWSNGETGPLSVTATAEAATYQANFTTQYLLTTRASPSFAGTLTANPASADGYYDSGSVVELTASPRTGYRLDYWSGDLGGYRNPMPLVVNDQKDVTARFTLPTSNSTAAVNAASLAPGAVAPGEIVTVFGANLGPAQPAVFQFDGSGKAPAELAGTRVTFDGVPAPILLASAGQSTVVVPHSVAGTSSARMVVQYQGVQSAAMSLGVAGSAPGIFAADGSGRGQGAILNEDGVTPNSPQNPAPRGSIVALYATGFGRTDPPGEDGAAPAGAPARPLLPVRLTIGGISAEILSITPYYVSGLMEVRARVPSYIEPGDYVPVLLTVGERSSLPAVTVSVR
jgi:astacin